MSVRGWRLELWWAVPRPPGPARLAQLIAEADAAAGWVLARSPIGLTVVSRVRSGRPDDELARFAERVGGWLHGRVEGARILSLRACADEVVAAELAHPDVPPLASAADVAQFLGLTRQRVQHLHGTDPRFPAPVARVATGPLWTVAAIRGYRRGRAAGDGEPAPD